MHTRSLDTIRIEGIEVLVFLGYFDWERRIAQPVHLDIEAVVEISGARYHDRLEQTLNYADIHANILRIAQSCPYALLEHLGQALLTEVVSHAAVLSAQIALRKPHILSGATPCVTIQGRRPAHVSIGLGANLGPAQTTLATAITRLADIGRLIAVSSLYRTSPWGPVSQPDFLNAAALIETHLLPQAVLAALKRLERELGREPGARWGPRILDLDLLDDDGAQVQNAELIVPHPRLFERAFALTPLAEIASQYGEALQGLTPEQRSGVVRVAEWPAWGANSDAS